MRTILSPSFTSSKMKIMFELISETSEQFVNHFYKKSRQTVEMKDVFSRLANDIIATTAFGVKCDSIADPNNEFFLMGKEISDFSGFWKILRLTTIGIFPKFAKVLKQNPILKHF